MKWIPRSTTGKLRAGVALAAVLMALVKLWIAKHTYGSYDVLAWDAFARTVREFGPVGIYGQQPTMDFFGDIREPLYNHPPMSGWMLLVMNWIADLGVGFPFLIKIPAIIADIGSALLVFELVRRLRPDWQAATAATLMTLSPVLITVSGFHGNTDPVFVMFTLLAVYLVVEKRPLLAGLSIGIALSVKLVPLVVLPLLLVYLFRAGWRSVARFAAGGAAVFALLWAPVFLSYPRQFTSNVLGYRGVVEHLYGVPQFAQWLEIPKRWIDLYTGPGSSLVLLICAAFGAWMVWRRPDSIILATGIALSAFLLLSPAFGVQYMAWAVAATFLIGTWAGAFYSAFAGAFVVQLYSTWSQAAPGHWWYGIPVYWRSREFALMTIAWLVLAVVIFIGLRAEYRLIRRQPSLEPSPVDSAEILEPLPDDLLAGVQRQ